MAQKKGAGQASSPDGCTRDETGAHCEAWHSWSRRLFRPVAMQEVPPAPAATAVGVVVDHANAIVIG
jgi:hypothetical protein